MRVVIFGLRIHATTNRAYQRAVDEMEQRITTVYELGRTAQQSRDRAARV